MASTTTLEGRVVKTTDKAVLFKPNDDDAFWIPRPVCRDGDAIDDEDTDLIVENWWLRKEGHM